MFQFGTLLERSNTLEIHQYSSLVQATPKVHWRHSIITHKAVKNEPMTDNGKCGQIWLPSHLTNRCHELLDFLFGLDYSLEGPIKTGR